MVAQLQIPDADMVVSKDTGFPEPLSPDRNTTLPHPDADTSQNATIEASDLDQVRTHSRGIFRSHSKRNSFQRTNTKGSISIEQGGLYDNIEYADGTKEKKSVKEISKETAARDDLVAAPKDEEIKQVGDVAHQDQSVQHFGSDPEGEEHVAKTRNVLHKKHPPR